MTSQARTTDVIVFSALKFVKMMEQHLKEEEHPASRLCLRRTWKHNDAPPTLTVPPSTYTVLSHSDCAVCLRRDYWKLTEARLYLSYITEISLPQQASIAPGELCPIFPILISHVIPVVSDSENGRDECIQRPITCFLYPGLTRSKLLEHMRSHNASDTCILEQIGRLQQLRKASGQKDSSCELKLFGQ